MWLESILGVLTLLLANRVIATSYPLHAVVALVAVFVAMSIQWIAIGAEFLGLALVFVYVGAVMTLFLFMVMMLNASQYPAEQRVAPWLVAMCAAVSVVGYAMHALSQSGVWFGHAWDWPVRALGVTRTHDLGVALYSTYVWPFLLVGLNLLVAMVVCVGLVMRGKQSRKSQSIACQIRTDPSVRVRLVRGMHEKER